MTGRLIRGRDHLLDAHSGSDRNLRSCSFRSVCTGCNLCRPPARYVNVGCSTGARGHGRRPLPEPITELCGRPAVVDCLGYVVRSVLDLIGSVAHRYSAASPAQHLDVVLAISERQHI
jgi:hypothetical protein